MIGESTEEAVLGAACSPCALDDCLPQVDVAVSDAAPELKDNIDVTAGENGTWTFTMPEANVWVKDAGTLAAGKCWIELVPSSPAHARALSIVFEGETTGINAVSSSADKMDGEWYDLSGYTTHTGRIVFDDYTAWRNIFAYPSL